MRIRLAHSDIFHDSDLATSVDELLGQAMKRLVNLFRANRKHNSSAGRSGRHGQRSLGAEALEKRELLANDVLAAHNYQIAADVNHDYKVTARDALTIINYISKNGFQDFRDAAPGSMSKFVDVNGDNKVTLGDALGVLNAMGRGEGVDELVEIRINPRTADDAAFGTEFNQSTRELTVGVNEVFNLEIQYNDLRNRIGGDFGVFALFTDILTSLPSTLEPAVTETQIVTVGGNIRSAATGTLQFSLSNAPTQIVTVPFDPGTFSEDTFVDALVALGYDASDVSVVLLAQEDDVNGPFEFQIRYTNFDLVDQNLPNLLLSGTFAAAGGAALTVTTPTEEILPRNQDGTINGIAFGLSLDFRSRTFGNNERFFGLLPLGEFNGTTGFAGVGAAGRLVESVPAAGNGRLIEPFDAFSIPVRVRSEITDPAGLRLSLQAQDGLIELYDPNLTDGGTDEGLPANRVLVNLEVSGTDATDGFGELIIRTGVTNVIVMAGDSSLNATEDTTAMLNLASLVTVTGSTAVPVFTVTTQAARGTASFSGSTLTYVPAGNDFTTTPLTIVYTATAGGASDTGTITVNIAAVNDAPVFTADPARSTTVGTPLTIAISDLLGNDLPGPANETGTVSIGTVTSPTATGATVVITGTNIVYTPLAGVTGPDTINYLISDGTLTAPATLAVNVNAAGVVVVANDATLPVTEDINATLNLSTLVTVTGSTTAPTFTITTQPARGIGTLAGSTLTYAPAMDDFTTTSLTLVYTATVGTSSDTGTITINIAPVNDPPVFVADTAVTATTATPLTIAVSTLVANDRPGPANETGTVSVGTVTAATTGGGNAVLSGTNIVYTSAAGFTGSDTINYTISDGSLTAPATLSVTVSAAGVVTVVANDATLPVTEDVNATLNLATLTTVTGSTGTPVFTITTQAARGVGTINGSTLTYAPAANDFTTTALTLVYTATVGTVSDTGTITINIAAVNDAPVFTADPARSTNRGTALTVAISELLANDRPGPANETGTVVIGTVTAATTQGGTAVINGTNIVYTPTATFTGSDTINYTISDGTLTAAATLTVNVVAPGAVTVAAGDATLTFAEDGAAQTQNLASLTTVTGSTAAATFTIVTQPARGTLVLSGSTATYTPAANDFTTTPLSFVYRATVGSTSDTGTVTINISAVNDAPIATADAIFARPNITSTFAVSVLTGNDRPGPANEVGQSVTLTAVNANSNTQGTVSLVGGNVIYTPPAGVTTGTDTFSYTISDGSLTATGVVTVTIAEFIPSTVAGTIFTDFLVSLANPIRNGVQDANEPSMGGLTVRLTSPANANITSTAINQTRMTNGEGEYSFGSLPPGTYTVSFEAPETIIVGSRIPGSLPTTGGTATSFQIVIGTPGGLNATGNNFTILGTQGAAADTLDLLVSQQIIRNSGVAGINGTALIALDATGDQQFFSLGNGYEDVVFAELALNERGTAALLSLLHDDGSVSTSLLGSGDFMTSRNGRVVRLIGTAARFATTDSPAEVLAAEFGDYRDSIDEIMRSM